LAIINIDKINLAIDKTATSSINPETAQGAIDGDLITPDDSHRFATRTAQYAGVWWQVDLESIQEVGRIVIYANPDASWSDFPTQWHLDYSTDGNSWSRLITESNSPLVVPLDYNVSKINARYLRITADTPNNGNWWYMQEFQVYN
jgi:hypothetical protein